VARVVKGELWLSHPYNAQTLDDHLVASCACRRAGYFPLNKFTNQSKNLGCGCGTARTGFAFLGIFVGDGIAAGDGEAVSVGVSGNVGVGFLVGILVGIRVGTRSGSGVFVGMTKMGCVCCVSTTGAV
jgi:hypothetical protein